MTIFGSAIHKVIEHATKENSIGTLFWRNPVDFILPTLRQYNLSTDEYGDLAIELVRNAINWKYFSDLSALKGCELPFDLTLTDDKTRIKGIIDRLDIIADSAEIMDIKTQKRAFSLLELHKNWQAKIYNIAVRKLHDFVKDVNVSFWVLRHRKQEIVKTDVDASVDEQELIQIADYIESVKNPTATTSGLCQWCPYKNECSARNHRSSLSRHPGQTTVR